MVIDLKGVISTCLVHVIACLKGATNIIIVGETNSRLLSSNRNVSFLTCHNLSTMSHNFSTLKRSAPHGLQNRGNHMQVCACTILVHTRTNSVNNQPESLRNALKKAKKLIPYGG